MEWIGLLLECCFLWLGIYLYRLGRGWVRPADPQAQQRAADFRARNGWWLRLAGLALSAIMLINIVLHLQQLLSN